MQHHTNTTRNHSNRSRRLGRIGRRLRLVLPLALVVISSFALPGVAHAGGANCGYNSGIFPQRQTCAYSSESLSAFYGYRIITNNAQATGGNNVHWVTITSRIQDSYGQSVSRTCSFGAQSGGANSTWRLQCPIAIAQNSYARFYSTTTITYDLNDDGRGALTRTASGTVVL